MVLWSIKIPWLVRFLRFSRVVDTRSDLFFDFNFNFLWQIEKKDQGLLQILFK